MIEPDEAALALGQQRRALVERAVDEWRGQLIDLGGRNQLLHYRDLKVGTLDLAGADETRRGRAPGGPGRDPVALVRRRRAPRCGQARPRSPQQGEGGDRGARHLGAVPRRGMATWTNTRDRRHSRRAGAAAGGSVSPLGAAEDDFELDAHRRDRRQPVTAAPARRDVRADRRRGRAARPAGGRGEADPERVFDQLAKEAASVPGFARHTPTVLGTFSYAKLPMVKDLGSNVDALVEHDVIAAIAGDRAARGAAARRRARPSRGEPRRDPAAATSSSSSTPTSQPELRHQAVVAGASLVVKGPPGTGKSQTIANLIATLVARGQEGAVRRREARRHRRRPDRLDRLGLGDLVLDLHDGVGSKRKVAQNLAAALDSAVTHAADRSWARCTSASDRPARAAQPAPDALHEKREPWGVSVFDAQRASSRCSARAATASPAARRRARPRSPAAPRGACGEKLRSTRPRRLHADRAGEPWVGARVTQRRASPGRVRRRPSGCSSRPLPARPPHPRAVLDADRAAPGRRRSTDGSSAEPARHGPPRPSPPRPGGASPPTCRRGGRRPPRAGWRKAHTAEPGADAGWGQRRQLRKQARPLWLWRRQAAAGEQLHAALDGRASLQRGMVGPRQPTVACRACRADLAGASGAYDQLDARAVRASAALPAHGAAGHAARPAGRETLERAGRRRGTLREGAPAATGSRASSTAAGSARCSTELSDPPSGRGPVAMAAFDACWLASILLRRLSFADSASASVRAAEHDRVARDFRPRRPPAHRRPPPRVPRAVAEHARRGPGRAPGPGASSSGARRPRSAGTCRCASCSRPPRTC